MIGLNTRVIKYTPQPKGMSVQLMTPLFFLGSIRLRINARSSFFLRFSIPES